MKEKRDMSKDMELLVDKIKIDVKNTLTPKRYEHVINVMETALLLNKTNIPKWKIEISALLHDFQKELSDSELIKICKRENFPELKNIENWLPILHGFVAYLYAKNILEIKDNNILNSIKYHSIGRTKMSELEKIIYLSDNIEPTRKYLGVEAIRNIAKNDIECALLLLLKTKIDYLSSQKKEGNIHPNTFLMKKWLLEEQKE